MYSQHSKTNFIEQKPGPFVKWAGGKRSVLQEVKKHFPVKFNHYYEPFLGDIFSNLNILFPNIIESI